MTGLRELKEIQAAEEEFFDHVWYDRHQGLCESKSFDKTPVEILDRAMSAAARIEQTYGKDNLGPYSDFEWGMISGKLSALRWVLGDDWDNLDS